MSEHEISKHTKAIYKEWKNPHHSWKHKLGEILTEIFIIVFAITLSLIVERWREGVMDIFNGIFSRCCSSGQN